MSNIYVGDNGTVVEISISDDDGAVNLTTATTITATFTKPDGTTFEKTFSVTDAAAGECNTTLMSADNSAAGIYTFKTVASFVNGSIFRGSVQSYLVKA